MALFCQAIVRSQVNLNSTAAGMLNRRQLLLLVSRQDSLLSNWSQTGERIKYFYCNLHAAKIPHNIVTGTTCSLSLSSSGGERTRVLFLCFKYFCYFKTSHVEWIKCWIKNLSQREWEYNHKWILWDFNLTLDLTEATLRWLQKQRNMLFDMWLLINFSAL